MAVLIAGPLPQAEAASACTTSAPLTKMVLPGTSLNSVGRHSYVEFSAVNSHGTYGGVAADGGGVFEMLRYDLAQKRLTVLDKISLNPWQDPGSVTAVGVDNSGAITFKILTLGRTAATYSGFRYAGGHKYALWHLRSWQSFEPESVAADGTVVGEILSNNIARAVKWTGPGTGYGSYIAGANTGEAFLDGRGNVAYYSAGAGDNLSLLSPSGGVRQLVEPNGDTLPNGTIWASAGYWIYGTATSPSGSTEGLRWRTADAPGTGPIRASVTTPIGYATGAGLNGTVVGVSATAFPNQGPEFYVKPGIPVHHMPAVFREDKYSDNAPVVVNPNGSVVFTGTDGLPRIVNCTA